MTYNHSKLLAHTAAQGLSMMSWISLLDKLEHNPNGWTRWFWFWCWIWNWMLGLLEGPQKTPEKPLTLQILKTCRSEESTREWRVPNGWRMTHMSMSNLDLPNPMLTHDKFSIPRAPKVITYLLLSPAHWKQRKQPYYKFMVWKSILEYVANIPCWILG